jgi:hypothetical protein
MNALRAFNGYTIPYSRWPISVSSYDEGKGKKRIFWIGRGSFSYKLTGKQAWTKLEVPEPPKEPDNRFCELKAWDAWYAEWMAYAKEYGLPLAACGLMCCDYSLQQVALTYYTQHDRYPPDELTVGLKHVLGVDPLSCGEALSYMMGGPWSLDMMGLLKSLMRQHGVNFDKWTAEVDQSPREWLVEKYGEGVAKQVETLLKWKPSQAAEARYQATVRELHKLRDEAMATCKAVRS